MARDGNSSIPLTCLQSAFPAAILAVTALRTTFKVPQNTGNTCSKKPQASSSTCRRRRAQLKASDSTRPAKTTPRQHKRPLSDVDDIRTLTPDVQDVPSVGQRKRVCRRTRTPEPQAAASASQHVPSNHSDPEAPPLPEIEPFSLGVQYEAYYGHPTPATPGYPPGYWSLEASPFEALAQLPPFEPELSQEPADDQGWQAASPGRNTLHMYDLDSLCTASLAGLSGSL